VETVSVHSIVIVDDEKSFTDMIGDLLQEHFTVPVHTFTRPEDALAKILTLRPGIIVTDYNMPGMNGIEFIRAAKAVSPATPCVIITGHTFNLDDHIHDNDLKNIKEVIPKPFRWQRLAETIKLHWQGENPPYVRVT
jgi:DNA-binding NtrC family response regulator